MLGSIFRVMPATVLAAALACGAHAQDKQAPPRREGRAGARQRARDVRRLPRHSRLQDRISDVYHVPKIAGQQPGYIINALKAYKSGERLAPVDAPASRPG